MPVLWWFSSRSKAKAAGQALGRIFISYAHADSTPLAEALERDLAARGFTVWRDTSRLRGGDSWTREIEQNLNDSQVVLALLSRASFRSDICRAEQLRALRRKICVIPVLVQVDADRPLHLETRQYVDFSLASGYESSFTALVTSIHSGEGATLPDRFRQTAVSVPNLPLSFVDRPRQREELRNLLLADGGSRHVAVTALHGMGGIGKTVLSAALCHKDPLIADAFPDGVAWVTLGREPGNMAERLRKLAAVMGAGPEGFDDLDSSLRRFRSIIQERAVLVVLDDVWQARDVEYFRAENAPRYRLLFTTRKLNVAAALGAQEYQLGTLAPEQSLALLGEQVGKPAVELPETAAAIAAECAGLPLALAMVGAKLRRRNDAYWADMLEDLRQARIKKIAGEVPSYAYPSLKAAFDISLADLDPVLRRRYFDFAVFPEDVAVPEAPLEVLWGIEAREVRDTTAALADLSLVTQGTDGVSLHDLQLDFLRAELGEDGLKERQHEFLAAYRGTCCDGWHTGRKERYFVEWLPHHLAEAGRRQEARNLLFDLPWMEAVLERAGLSVLIAHYRLAQPSEPHRLVERALNQSSHVISGSPVQLSSQLYARLMAVEEPGLAELRAQLRPTLGCIVPLWPALTQADSKFCTLEGHANSVHSVALSGDGGTLVSGSSDNTIKVWDLGTGACRTLEGHAGAVYSVALSGDGRTLVSAGWYNPIEVWDLGTGTCRTLEGHKGTVMSVALSGDGRTLVSGSADRTIKVWDLGTGACRTLEGHAGGVHSVALSGDGRTVVSGGSYDQTIKVWDLGTGACRRLEGHAGGVYSVVLSGDGGTLASGSEDKMIKVWDLGTGACRRLEGHAGAVYSVVLSSDRRTLVSGSKDKTIKVWDLGTGACRTLKGHGGEVRSVVLSGDGRTLVSGSADRTIKVWDLGMGASRTLERHADTVVSVALDGDGRTLVSGSKDKTIKVWDLGTGACRALEGHASEVESVALSGDGGTLVSSSRDQTIKVWDLGTGACRTLEGHARWVLAGVSVALSGDGRTLVSGSAGRRIKVWDLGTGACRTLKGRAVGVRPVALSGDGRTLVSGSAGKTIKVWDLGTGACRTLEGHADEVRSVALSGDGRTLASGSKDKMIKVWDLGTGACRTLEGHADEVRSVALSGDGRTLVSGSRDQTIKVWDLGTGSCRGTFFAEAPIWCVALSSGNRLGAGDAAGGVYLFEIRPDKN